MKQNIQKSKNKVKKKVKSKDMEKKQTSFNIFRTDHDTTRRLEILEDVTEKSKTDIIKEAIKMSHTSILIQNTIKKMFPIFEEELGKVRIGGMGFGSRKEKGDMDKMPPDLSFNEGWIDFELSDHKFKTKDKEVHCFLDKLVVKIEIKGIRSAKFTIIKPILTGPVDKIDPSLFKNLHEIANKNDLYLKSRVGYKGSTVLEFSFERETDLEGKEWIEPLSKDIASLKSAIRAVEKNPFFIKEELEKEE